MCNVRGMNNLAKQDDIVHWHKDINNLVSIFTETKLKRKVHPWIANKFNSLLFKNRLSVLILGLYVSASSAVCFSQADTVNFLIVKATNESTFIILSGNFNKDGSYKCVSFKKCFSLGLVNSLAESSVTKMSTWKNSRSVIKTINYIFVFSSLVNVILCCNVLSVSKHFNTDHHAVSVSISLGGLLDVQLNSFCKQTNRDHWKFDFNNTNKNAIMANTAMFSDKFATSKKYSDLDAMWNTIHKVGYDKIFTKELSRIYKLKVLVSRLAKASYEVLISSDTNSDCIHSALFDMKKSYYASKLTESLCAEKSGIRSAIKKWIESFTVNKGYTIHSVLEHFFQKVVLDHLVSDGSLIVDPVDVKNNVDKIIESWTRKKMVPYNIPDLWQHQYLLLGYVDNDAFSGVMETISYKDLVHVIKNLSDSKATGLSACSVFDVLYGDNFSMLKGTTIQSPIFAIGSVIEDALEKNHELWLVLQDMQKAYDSVG
ncbi:hypothetical protein G9A89_016144 [Geosiphon pyriformis]|nr:hypothetical protein G9A89_016144 [Geosiphon pyriformis]